MGRCKIHIHSHKNAGESCFMCKASLNRKAKNVEGPSGKVVKVCTPCKDKYSL